MGENTKRFYLRASLQHPNRSFRIQGHAIGADFAAFDLTEKEQKELHSPGGKKWVEQGSEKDFKDAEARRKRLKKLDKQPV